MEAKRILKDVDVQFISLVSEGANQKTIIWKSAKPTEKPTFTRTIPISKTDDEKRLVYGIVYAPNEVDTDGDTMLAKDIEQMSYDFMNKARTNKVDDSHDFVADDGFVAESWILKSADPLFPDESVGSWAVGIKVTNDETWEKVKSGEIGGLSLAGTGTYEEVEKSVSRETKDGFIIRVAKKLGLKKDILDTAAEARVLQNVMWDGVYNLEDLLYNIMNNPLMPNRREVFLQAIDNFRSLAENNLEDQSVTKNKGEEMTTEELKKTVAEAVGTAVSEAVTPLTERVDALEKSVNERIEKIEKSTNGKTSTEGQETTVEKQTAYLWTGGLAEEIEEVA
jgi:tetrahydromethanopterin S-methyltransferase subunit B